MENNKELKPEKQCDIHVVVNSTVYLDNSNYYGDGQFYYDCNNCGEQHCARMTETKECICGHKTYCIYNYE
jgi:hypothetical protein